MSLSSEVRDALSAFAHNERVLILMDFDGVLSDLIDDPSASQMREGSRVALTDLSHLPFTDVGIVTGRPLADILAVAMPPEGVLVVASHGLEFLQTSPGDDIYKPTEADTEILTALGAFLTPLAEAVPGAWLETKPAGIAVQTRLCEPAAGRQLLAIVRELPDDLSSLTIRGGKDVLEFSVSSATKGTAVKFLAKLKETGNILFVGDDVTDEDAFAALPVTSIGVKVGPGETFAAHRIADTTDVTELLELLVTLRTHAS
ncbi:MAG: trehalose-phosphatase [Actinomycetales bacterium]|nr:trehalose-phosphatase [Actinomycetales bacterium]